MEAFVAASDLPKAPGRPFYTAFESAVGRERLQRVGRVTVCTDSRSRGEFLGLSPADAVPNHSGVNKTLKRRLCKTVWLHLDRLISAFDRLVSALYGYVARRSTAICVCRSRDQ
jgi:hypothetical protein